MILSVFNYAILFYYLGKKRKNAWTFMSIWKALLDDMVLFCCNNFIYNSVKGIKECNIVQKRHVWDIFYYNMRTHACALRNIDIRSKMTACRPLSKDFYFRLKFKCFQKYFYISENLFNVSAMPVLKIAPWRFVCFDTFDFPNIKIFETIENLKEIEIKKSRIFSMIKIKQKIIYVFHHFYWQYINDKINSPNYDLCLHSMYNITFESFKQ